MSRLRLVTFDIMNTLLKTKRSIGQEYLDIFSNRFGIQFEAGRVDEEFPKIFKSMWEVQPNFGTPAGMSSREWWSHVVRASVQNAGVDVKDPKIFDDVSKAADLLFDHYRTTAPWNVIESSRMALSVLKKQYKIGAISNFDERLTDLIADLGLQKYFDFVVVSRNVGFCKPDKQIFDLAMEKAGETDPSLALHVGDNLLCDYKAAKEAGWNAVWLCRDEKERLTYPLANEEVVSDLMDLMKLPVFAQEVSS